MSNKSLVLNQVGEKTNFLIIQLHRLDKFIWLYYSYYSF